MALLGRPARTALLAYTALFRSMERKAMLARPAPKDRKVSLARTAQLARPALMAPRARPVRPVPQERRVLTALTERLARPVLMVHRARPALTEHKAMLVRPDPKD